MIIIAILLMLALFYVVGKKASAEGVTKVGTTVGTAIGARSATATHLAGTATKASAQALGAGKAGVGEGVRTTRSFIGQVVGTAKDAHRTAKEAIAKEAKAKSEEPKA